MDTMKIPGINGKDTAADMINKQTQKRKRAQENAGVGAVKKIPGFNENYKSVERGKAKKVGVRSRFRFNTNNPFNFENPPHQKNVEELKTSFGQAEPHKDTETELRNKFQQQPPVKLKKETTKGIKKEVAKEMPYNREVWGAAKQGWLDVNYDKPNAEREVLFNTDKRLYNKTYNDTYKLTPQQEKHNEALRKQYANGVINRDQYENMLERSWAELHGGKNHAYLKALGSGMLRGVSENVLPRTTGFIENKINSRDQQAQRQYQENASAMHKNVSRQASQYANEIQKDYKADLQAKREAYEKAYAEAVNSRNQINDAKYKKAKAEYEQAFEKFKQAKRNEYRNDKRNWNDAFKKYKTDEQEQYKKAKAKYDANKGMNLNRYKKMGGI